MRNFVLLLVFLNMVYFFWSVTAIQPVKQEWQPSSIETLVLLPKTVKVTESKIIVRELERKVNITKTETPVLKGAVLEEKPSAKLHCVEIGDYDSQLLAQKSLEKLISASGDVLKDTRVFMRAKIKRDYWVIYPAADGWEQSKTNAKMIQSKGITDLWLVPNGVNKGIVSLGLFAVEKQAKISAESLLQKGLQVEIVQREKKLSRYLILLKSTNSDDVLEGRIKATLERLDLRINKISC